MELPLDSKCSRPTGQSSEEEDVADDDEKVDGELIVVLMEEEAAAAAGLVTALRRIDRTSDIRSFLNC